MTAANVSDTAGFRLLVVAITPCLVRLVRIYLDGGYMISLFVWMVAITQGRCMVEWVQKVKGQVGFAVQPKRWIVERALGWLNWSRRLSKDYEQTTASSQAWIDLSAMRGNLGKLTRN